MTTDINKNKENSEEKKSLPPDEKTLHTPDPQEKMEGPVWSPMHKLGEGFDTNESKKEADKKRDERL